MSDPGAADLRLGLVLPTFTSDGSAPLAAARAAEAAGIHGVFCYDHLWPMGKPGEPALSPYLVLPAVASVTTRVAIGTLVARVGLVRTEVLVSQLRTLSLLAPGRFIAAVGTGDRHSEAENLAYGIAYAPAAERRAMLREVVAHLRDLEVTTWVGGGSAATNAVARELGAVLNLWNPSSERLRVALGSGPTTWGGSLPRDPALAVARLVELRDLGVTWAVFNWPGSAERLAEVARGAGVALG